MPYYCVLLSGTKKNYAEKSKAMARRMLVANEQSKRGSGGESIDHDHGHDHDHDHHDHCSSIMKPSEHLPLSCLNLNIVSAFMGPHEYPFFLMFCFFFLYSFCSRWNPLASAVDILALLMKSDEVCLYFSILHSLLYIHVCFRVLNTLLKLKFVSEILQDNIF